MHVRRALLLFAIVLGLAALATSVSRPPREGGRGDRSGAAATPEAVPGPRPERGAERLELRLPDRRGRRAVALPSGVAATLLVSVPEAGRVDLPTLGLSSPAEPLTPARFDVLGPDPGRYEVHFTPAGAGSGRDYGRVVVR